MLQSHARMQPIFLFRVLGEYQGFMYQFLMCWVCFMFLFFAFVLQRTGMPGGRNFIFFQRHEWQIWVRFISEYGASPFGEYLELKQLKYFHVFLICQEFPWADHRCLLLPCRVDTSQAINDSAKLNFIDLAFCMLHILSMFCRVFVRLSWRVVSSIMFFVWFCLPVARSNELDAKYGLNAGHARLVICPEKNARKKVKHIQFSFFTWNRTQRNAVGWKLNSKILTPCLILLFASYLRTFIQGFRDTDSLESMDDEADEVIE